MKNWWLKQSGTDKAALVGVFLAAVMVAVFLTGVICDPSESKCESFWRTMAELFSGFAL